MINCQRTQHPQGSHCQAFSNKDKTVNSKIDQHKDHKKSDKNKNYII